MRELFYATTNEGKFNEVKSFFSHYKPTVAVYQYEGELLEIQTNDQGLIAAHKAQQAWHQLKKPVLVDDAGIYFEKYNAFPGTMSKFVYQGIGFEGLLKLADHQDKATFKVSVAYAYGPDKVEVFDGLCNGFIVHPTIFDAPPSLPYLAIFVPHGETRTLAELRSTTALTVHNPRVRALEKFLKWHQEHS